MLTPDALTPTALRAWVHDAMDRLTRARTLIDRANVFPVADADTGTNMCLTLRQGCQNVDALPPDADVDAVLHALAEGALLGARGNSGVILSEYLRGFAAGARQARRGPVAATLVTALRGGARCAYDAVGHPRQGTILTAAAGAADAAQAAYDDDGDLVCVLQSARTGALDALRRSVDDLDVLRAAGVLDAGAYGLVLVLDALCRALGADEPVSAAPESMSSMTFMTTLNVEPSASAGPPDVPDGGHASDGHSHDATLDGEFEVMYVVEHDGRDSNEVIVPLDDVATYLRTALQKIGASVAVVGGATGRSEAGARRGLWQVHVHTDRPLDALKVGQGWTQRQIVVRSLVEQVSRAAGASAQGTELGDTSVVACTASPGLVPELARAGAVVVLRGSVPVAPADLQRAVEETRARAVVLLPADPETAATARAWAAGAEQTGHAGQGGAQVDVVESSSDLHVVAATTRWVTIAPETSTDVLVESLRASLESHRSIVLRDVGAQDGPTPAGLSAVLSDLLEPGTPRGEHRPATVLTVLADDLVPEKTIDGVVSEAQLLVPHIDVVRLSSGRHSATLALGVEVDD